MKQFFELAQNMLFEAEALKEIGIEVKEIDQAIELRFNRSFETEHIFKLRHLEGSEYEFTETEAPLLGAAMAHSLIKLKLALAGKLISLGGEL